VASKGDPTISNQVINREAFFTKQSLNELQDDLPSKTLNLIK